MRALACWALGQIESPRALDALREAQQDQSSSVRRAAKWAIRQVDDNQDEDSDVHPHVWVHSKLGERL